MKYLLKIEKKHKPYYDNQSQWLRINSYASTGQAIQAPFTFYYVRDNDWSESHNWDYWNKNFTSDPGITNAATAKTIYSPSPSGFVEPKTAAFTGFTSTGANTNNSSQFNVSGSFTKGWNFYTNGWKTGSTIFFDALGLRDTYSGRSSGTGAVVRVGEEVHFWASGASSASFGRLLDFGSGGVDPQIANARSYGFSVRPVKE